ncbi:hypothetical protein [Rossellomorea aquimaris]|uniref:Uncharacterized protein n=1 Tax=Rossellomorea aquimaris TaxID=189382 RepID=A0A1J6X0N2_9BACI|nr:hypothetical protein [Rossellomorea aquimaris]OIU71705.1 hypothetical protein BHE18_03325 [Rossellomorea aquimaris]
MYDRFYYQKWQIYYQKIRFYYHKSAIYYKKHKYIIKTMLSSLWIPGGVYTRKPNGTGSTRLEKAG